MGGSAHEKGRQGSRRRIGTLHGKVTMDYNRPTFSKRRYLFFRGLAKEKFIFIGEGVDQSLLGSV